jgi:hypothetical protein
MSGRADEVPLAATEVARSRRQNDELIQTAKSNLKPAGAIRPHVGIDGAARNFAPV